MSVPDFVELKPCIWTVTPPGPVAVDVFRGLLTNLWVDGQIASAA